MRVIPGKDAPARSGEWSANELLHHSTILVSAKRVAEMLEISPRFLWSLTKCGAIPAHRIGRLVRYDLEEVCAWVRAECPTEPGAGDAIREGIRS